MNRIRLYLQNHVKNRNLDQRYRYEYYITDNLRRCKYKVLYLIKRLRRRQYDSLIIERTIGLVLGPSTALYRPFLKHFTLTNKAVGTIWRALPKPSQRRRRPDFRPVLLLIGTPSAIRPELASRRAEHSQPYSDVTIFYFCYITFIIFALRVSIFMTSPLGRLLVCCLYKEVYLQMFNVCPFDYTTVAGNGKVGPVDQVNHTNRMDVVCCH